MKQRIEAPVFTWFLIGALLFSTLTFLLGIWVCSNAPRSGYENGEEVPTVMETAQAEEPAPLTQNTEEEAGPQTAIVKPAITTQKPPGIKAKNKRKTKTEHKDATKKRKTRKAPKKPTQKKINTSRARTSTARPEKIYYVQLTATANRKMAEKMKQAYAGKGYNMYLVTGKKHGNPLYKVRIGVFKDWKKAKSIAEKIRREDKLKPWIIAM